MMLEWDWIVETYLAGIVKGIIHVGAHFAEEAEGYGNEGIPVWWIEADPSLLEYIEEVIKPYPEQRLIHALVTDKNRGKRQFNVSNNDGMSSSVLEFGTHAKAHPDTVFVEQLSLPQRTLDSLVAQYEIEANMLVMDIQGAEGLALAGAKNLLPSLDFVMSEVNVKEVYKGCARLKDLDGVLAGFERVEIVLTAHGWGDALWARDGIYDEPVPTPRETIFLPAEDRVEVIRYYARRFHVRDFVETGTSVGATTTAVLTDFGRIDTVELDQWLYEQARNNFAEYEWVSCWQGDSGVLLPQILAARGDPVLFWLDGHYCGPGSAHGDLDTPIRAELVAALKAPAGSVILIDDARVFVGGAEHDLEPHYRDYPSLDWVRETAEKAGFSYELRDDIIRLTPR